MEAQGKACLPPMSASVQPLVWMLPKSGYLESCQFLRWRGQNHLWWASCMKSQGVGGPIQVWELRDVIRLSAPSTSDSAFLKWPPSQGTPEPLDSFPPLPSSATEKNCLITKFHSRGFPGSSDGKKSACNVGYCPWGHKESDMTEWLTHKFDHCWRSLVGCSPQGRWELDTTEQLHFQFSLSCIGEGNGDPLHCSCLENPRDRGAWWAAICGVAQSRTWLKWLSSSSSRC